MEDNEKSEMAKSGAAIAGELIKAAKDDPNVKKAGGELGKAALTISKAVNNALMPIAAVNFAFDKASEYFANKFEDDIAEKLQDVPPELLTEPKASIAGPALQGLAFSHDEKDLKEMYLNLLALSMNGETAHQIHPAFVEIIRQLSSEEIVILGLILKSDSARPMVELRLKFKDKGSFKIIHRNCLNIINTETRVANESSMLSSQVDNWVRLGLVTTGFDKQVSGDDAYSWVADRPEYKRCKAEQENSNEIVLFEKGYLERSSFGEQFAKAVGMIEDQKQ